MRNRENGHSLIELVVALAMAATLAALAVPQFAVAAARYRERAVVSEFASELRQARLLALSKRQRVEVRLADDRQSIDLVLNDDEQTVLRRYDFHGRGVALLSWPEERPLWFHPTGRSASAATILLGTQEANPRRITVSLTGRVVVS